VQLTAGRPATGLRNSKKCVMRPPCFGE
jgi:hypothetical protein